MADNQQPGTTTLQLVLAWGFVGIPLTLGVLQTLINAMKLFPVEEQRHARAASFQPLEGGGAAFLSSGTSAQRATKPLNLQDNW